MADNNIFIQTLQDIHVKVLPKRVDTFFKILSYAGCSLSMIGLLVTMAMYLSDRLDIKSVIQLPCALRSIIRPNNVTISNKISLFDQRNKMIIYNIDSSLSPSLQCTLTAIL